MRPRHLVLTVLAALAFGAGATIASGQNQSPAATGFVQGQSSTLTVPTTATSTNVPGYAGDATNLQSYADNPTGLQSAGAQAGANTNDPLVGLTNTSLDKRNANAVDLNADWLKTAMGVTTDPYSMVKDSSGQAQTVCKPVTKTTTATSKSLYTCETAKEVSQTVAQCKKALVIDTQTTNTYQCKSTYNQTTKQWVLSTECTNLANASNCTPGSTTCTTPAQPYYTNASCAQGTQWSTSDQSCTKTLTTSTSTYGGTCTETKSGSSWTSSGSCGLASDPNCSAGARTCTANSPPTYSNQSCTQGTTYSSSSQSCTMTKSTSTSVTYGSCSNLYNPSTGQWNNTCNSIGNGCSIISTVCGSESSPTYQSYSCQTQTRPSQYSVGASCVVDTVTGENSCGPYAGNSACGYTGFSTESYGYYDEEGQFRVTGTRYTYNYLCTYSSGLNDGCTGYASNSQCSEVSSYCADAGCSILNRTFSCKTGNGSCTRYDSSYQCSTTTESWSGNCDSLAGDNSCRYQSEQNSGNTITRSYTCSFPTSVNTCSGLSGCSQIGSSCAAYSPSGSCSAYNYTYQCQTSAGGCSQYQTTYSCSATTSSWSTGCDSLANNANCSLKNQSSSGNTVTQNYTCNSSQGVNTCTGMASCTQTGSTCAGYAPNGSCSVYNYTYKCPADDGSGGCSVKTTTYTCNGSVANAGQPTSTSTTQTGSHWEQQGSCPAGGDSNCSLTSTTCTQAGGTRTVNGVNATADCWEKTDSYTCTTRSGGKSNCEVPSGCTWQSDNCLDDSCDTVDHVYACVTTTTSTSTEQVCDNKLCLGDTCYELNKQTNDELPQTFAQLAAMSEAGKDYAADLSVFKGEPLRCRKAILGFRNCCKDSGWGLSIGLAQCDDQEKKLMARQDAKATHYVGTYCSNKSLLGVCLEKAMSYCGFDSSLGRIIQEAGRTQLGKSWGAAKSPDCSGFTVDEFQQLDLSNVDFSDFYADKMKSLTGPDPNATATRIQNSISNLYGTQSNPNGGL